MELELSDGYFDDSEKQNIVEKAINNIKVNFISDLSDYSEEEENTIIYEGHDVQRNYNHTDLPCDQVDQPMYTPTGALTENGKFYKAAMRHKNEKAEPELVKVYEKIKDGIWVYNGFFKLVDSWIKGTGQRKVFKFKLVKSIC